jgi:hypothetical protein
MATDLFKRVIQPNVDEALCGHGAGEEIPADETG